MKTIKKHIYLYIIGMSLLATHANAQTKPAEQRAKDLPADMNCEIGLLGSQVPKIYAINLEACLKMDTAEAASGADLKLYHKKGKLIDKARDEKLRDALTPEQFARYERISKGNRHALKASTVCRPNIPDNNAPNQSTK